MTRHHSGVQPLLKCQISPLSFSNHSNTLAQYFRLTLPRANKVLLVQHRTPLKPSQALNLYPLALARPHPKPSRHSRTSKTPTPIYPPHHQTTNFPLPDLVDSYQATFLVTPHYPPVLVQRLLQSLQLLTLQQRRRAVIL